MWTTVIILAVSLYLLYQGSLTLVKYSSLLAVHFGITKLVIALTIVALGTSMPEVITTFVAGWQHQYGVALGDIIGTNIANIGLILGLAAVIRPLHVRSKTLRQEIPFSAAAVTLIWLFSRNNVLSSMEGAILLLLSLTFILFMVYVARSERVLDEAVAQLQAKLFFRTSAKNLFFIFLGLLMLIGGAKLLVDSAVAIAVAVGLSQFAIAASIVAIGTSIPELATVITASIKRDSDIVLGTIIGSNILNILLALGLTAVFVPLVIEPSIKGIDIPMMMGITFLLVLMLRTKYVLSRLEGFILLLLYGLYIYSVVT